MKGGTSDFFSYCLSVDGYMRGWSNEAKLAYGGSSAIRCEPLKWGSFALHSDGDNRDGSATWSTMVDVARPRCAVFLRADESDVESNDRRRMLCYYDGDCEH